VVPAIHGSISVPGGVRMDPLVLVRLAPLMERTRGNAAVKVAIADGPVVITHPDLAAAHIRQFGIGAADARPQLESIACQHGTFVSGILFARRGSTAPAICPDCTMLILPIFEAARESTPAIPEASAETLASAIIASVEAGAHVLNLSVGLSQSYPRGSRQLVEAIDRAARRGMIIVAAAGNQGSVGSSVVTSHPWVITVSGCDRAGLPIRETNLSASIGRRGLSAPAEDITSLGANGKSQTFSGTSAAVPFVTGTVALLYSVFPTAAAADVKLAVIRHDQRQRKSIAPPLLDAWASYQKMASIYHGRATA
jgi:subtilisin family serine protease